MTVTKEFTSAHPEAASLGLSPTSIGHYLSGSQFPLPCPGNGSKALCYLEGINGSGHALGTVPGPHWIVLWPFHASESPTDRCLLSSSGVTFSFFWKTQGEQTRPASYAYGGQVVSEGFKVCSSGGKGSVELYTRDNSMTWKATFNPPGEFSTSWSFRPISVAQGSFLPAA